jgi:Domain of unknown function (DUF4382)
MKNIFIAAASLLMIAGCSKDQSSPAKGTSNLTIQLTDNPYNATEVNVQILQVRVNFKGDSTGWMDLDTKDSIYNLLDLQNGVVTPLAQGNVPADTLREIRFILGDSNSIKIGNDVFPMKVPSGSESGLKIKLNKKLHATLDSLVIDFDAALSIVKTGNDKYILKPVLKIK